MADRRQSIMDAALPIFVKKGYSSTTIADVRRVSGATTGSIYHFFAGKPGIAVAIWKAANLEWEQNTIALRKGDSPREMIEATVLGLMRWALQDRALFLFYEEMRIRALTDPDLVEILNISRLEFEKAAAVYRTWKEAGFVREIPWPLASALIVGPAYDYLKKCGDIKCHSKNTEALAHGAWEVIRSQE